MNHIRTLPAFWRWTLAALPLAALVAFMLVLSMGSNANDVSAAANNEWSHSAPANVTIGTEFDVTVSLDKLAETGYTGFQVRIDNPEGGINYGTFDASTWPECKFTAGAPGDGNFFGCAADVNIVSVYTGLMITMKATCKSKDDQTLRLLHDDATGTNLVNEGGASVANDSDGASEDVIVSCVNATNTPTPTPTPTPPPVPRIQKLPALSNLFLERSGTVKIPPVQCVGPEGGTIYKVLAEQMSISIEDIFPDPKDANAFQQLGAFEFAINYDDTKVCVTIDPGFAATNMLCVVEDSETKPLLEGVARIGCVTLGKDVTPPDTNEATGRNLALIRVYPQPEVFSQTKPNQDNGVMVQINNIGCELADLQGHPIGIFSCEDADITIRYLEGDVEPDCSVDVVDQQGIAFRWGVEKGSLIYNDRFNLEPSGAQSDNDIDIKDLQFVYGRFGSKCTSPHPDQDPINPKA